MSSSTVEIEVPPATGVSISEDLLSVSLSDGRIISVPLEWYPRLAHGSVEERRKWRLVGGGEGIHWPDLDEDVGVAGLLAGKASGESAASFEKWLAGRD